MSDIPEPPAIAARRRWCALESSRSCWHPHRGARSAGEVEEHGLDALVDVALLRQVELAEDAVDVLLHGADRQHEGTRDRAVVLAGGHLAQDLELPRRQPGQRRLCATATYEGVDDLRVDHGLARCDRMDRRDELR